MKQDLWAFYTHWIAPFTMLFMGALAIRRIWREWWEMSVYMKALYAFSAVVWPVLGVLALAYAIWDVTGR